jgi:hypothetical protein
MSQRDMSYDLDGVFASRNQGQLVSAQASQQQIVRTPGLVPLHRTQQGFLPMGEQLAGGWMDSTTDLPLIGTVSNKTLLLGAAGLAGAVALFFILKRKKA